MCQDFLVENLAISNNFTMDISWPVDVMEMNKRLNSKIFLSCQTIWPNVKCFFILKCFKCILLKTKHLYLVIMNKKVIEMYCPNKVGTLKCSLFH